MGFYLLRIYKKPSGLMMPYYLFIHLNVKFGFNNKIIMFLASEVGTFFKRFYYRKEVGI